jgi:hypothetical protein
MILDIARLLLFPALMAFAAASDLFTMTISNRVSLALVAGFLVLAPAGGMEPTDMLAHAGAGLTVLAIGFTCFAMGWERTAGSPRFSAIELTAPKSSFASVAHGHGAENAGETKRNFDQPSVHRSYL